MKIECPVKNYAEAKVLLEAGVDILYGAVPAYLFGDSIQAVSRRPWKECNISSLTDLKCICQLVNKKKKLFYLALNEHFYQETQLTKIIDFLKVNRYLKNIIAVLC